MGTARWSDSELREFLRRINSSGWSDESSDEHESACARFRAAARSQLSPRVHDRLLEKIGVVVDREGIAIIADELLHDWSFERERRWALATPAPWDYLADWVAEVLARDYRKARGIRRTEPAALEALEISVREDA